MASKRSSPPSARPLTLGYQAASKINAVEGIRLSEESRRLFERFDREKLSPEQRRRALIAKHAKKA